MINSPALAQPFINEFGLERILSSSELTALISADYDTNARGRAYDVLEKIPIDMQNLSAIEKAIEAYSQALGLNQNQAQNTINDEGFIFLFVGVEDEDNSSNGFRTDSTARNRRQ